MIIIYIYIAHNNQEDSLCTLQELSYSYSEKRYIFKDFIKLLVSAYALSLSGNLFHKIGAADANARSPYVQVDEVATTNKCLLEERTFLWGIETFMELVRSFATLILCHNNVQCSNFKSLDKFIPLL